MKELNIRLNVVGIPAGVVMMIQRGRNELLPPVKQSADAITFELTIRVKEESPPTLLGEYVQGPPTGRFLYVNSGVRAGQSESCWDRRAKVSLMNISTHQVEQAIRRGRFIEATISGVGRDGGPPAGSVDLIDKTWLIN